MKNIFKHLSRLTPHLISLLMIIAASMGMYDGTFSLFEFWVLLGLSQVITSVASINTRNETLYEIMEEVEEENQQLNS
jgi:hypothetical protein